MKKTLILGLVLFLSGCSVIKITDDYERNINNIFKHTKKTTNMVGNGYSYYVPQGLRVEKEIGYNKILYSNNNKYYLYIDAVSYYYKTDIDYEINGDAYYSKKLNCDNKNGYLEINKIDNKYFIEMMYNYGKVEVIVNKDEIKEATANISYILSNLKFNDKILDTIIGDKILDFKEERFDIFKPTRKGKNLLELNEEYSNIYENDDDIFKTDIIELIEEEFY